MGTGIEHLVHDQAIIITKSAILKISADMMHFYLQYFNIKIDLFHFV